MSTFEIIVSVATLVGVIFNICTSKWCVRRRIERNQRRIDFINDYQFRMYTKNKIHIHPEMAKMDIEKRRLQDKIEELRKDL